MKKLLFSGVLILSLVLISCSGNNVSEDNTIQNETNNNEPVVSENEPIVSEEEPAENNTVVKIKDSELEKLIRDEIEKPEGDLLPSDMEKLYRLNINFDETPVYELDGLEHAINLENFSFRNGTLKSLNPVSDCSDLYYLNMSYSKLEEAVELFNTPLLETVSFIDTNVSDFSFLKSSNIIGSLNLIRCDIENIDFLENMNELESLGLSENRISDVSVINNKTELIDLDLGKNQIVDLESLSTCNKLVSINISYNNVTSIAPLFDLDNLIEVIVYEDLDQKIIDRAEIQRMLDKGVGVLYHE